MDPGTPSPPSDRRRHAPATLRNREPILAVLRRVLPSRGTVLEIAAGTGEHAAFFAAAFPALTWQPTDGELAALDSVAAWREESGCRNLLAPLHLDVTSREWPVRKADAVFNANMIHIAPWEACLGLLDGCARCLASGGLLVMYGPYRIGGAHTAPSNEAFDRDLRARNPAWGVRDLEEVKREAGLRGLHLEETVPMPANNFVVVLRRA